MSELKLLAAYVEDNNISISEGQLNKLSEFRRLLIEKNKVLNLTAIEDPEEIEIKHFIDSIVGANIIDELTGESFRMIDVGCGGGFPGIPLAVLFDRADVTMMDSLNKKIAFVNEAIEKLELRNARAIAARAEDFARTEERESFDICVSRAVADMAVLLEYCLPLVKVDGYCVLYKSGKCEDELENAGEALKVLGGGWAEIKKFTLPKEAGERSIVVIRKEKAAPDKYPRRPGKPLKSPIKNSGK